MNRVTIFLFSFFIFQFSSAWAQDLLDLLEEDEAQTTEYAYATFKATRIVNGQSIENPPNGGLTFVISHHFGRINEGWYEFFGLDQANIRFGFEYGINDWLAVGIGRSSVAKTYDGSLKVKIFRQSKGLRNMPVSLSYWTNVAITSLKWQEPERTNYFTSRMEYAHQLLIARKFGNSLSLQLTPTFIHRNLVETIEDQNDVWAVGAGGRVKVTNRLSVNAEYFYLLPGQTADDFYNSFSVGIDLETGGHVFAIYLTNSQGLIEEQFIPKTDGTWGKGDIHIGFNINRTFQLKKKK
jgi:opacity protein-like surface antigen